ncbi:nitroreductase family protein [Microbacterium sp. NIBRBAC000506063]|nr:nitroreductase family protein [Microbacterium sp. NIBRBAC000506063]
MSADANELLQARYGRGQAPELSIDVPEALALLLRHRSVRAFTDAPVGDDAVTAIIAAAQSASSSSNHQAYSIIEVRDPARKQRLVERGRGSLFLPRRP